MINSEISKNKYIENDIIQNKENDLKENKNNINNYNSLSEEFNTLTKNIKLKDNKNENLENLNTENMLINTNYINELRDYYEKHINQSYQNFKTCLNKLEEIAKQNNNKDITPSLLKEIIDDTIFYEREKQIMNFIKEIKETQAQKEKIKNELKQNEINSLNKKLETELNKKKNYKKISRELTATIEKKNFENNELQKKVTNLEQEKKENIKAIQKKREEFEKIKKDITAIETQKFEIEIKYKNLMEENLSLEKINKNYKNNKKLLFQGIEEERKKIKGNLVKERDDAWVGNLKNKINDIKNMKKFMTALKNEYKKKSDEFMTQYKNSIILIQGKIDEFDKNNKINIKKIEKKYEKHLNDQLIINNKLQRQNEELVNKKNENNIDSQNMTFKINELTTELNNHKAMIERLKMELEKKDKENMEMNEKNLSIVKNLNNFLKFVNCKKFE